MKENAVLLDPTAELSPAERELLPRPENLSGKTIGLLDISKARGEVFINRLGELMAAEGLSIRHYKKPTFARVAPLELYQQIVMECQVVVEALAD
ncbi:MAG: hypothetical protein HN580_25750 [Deltaproteobacteria bacterium]|jgi:hypothetical protein|nr:hypothetical protein [Deltaproteobacteria bacterium]MBT4267321.1 hypothetical protein [Deltaproteobacteria bacterium]MBT4638214.1 hypothetical protein [Deltaproteobacteria bacterium]MBT6501374.1 hypothetical protein [Deltaproteobacteria bacterium]MBT6616245.1 hypothetical protein [Deltaproteobacteria bacterium]